MKFTVRQQRFIEAYLRTGNATQAAIEAGYSAKTAYSQGHRLLKKAEIVAEIQHRRKEESRKAFMSKKDYVSKTYKNYLEESARDTKRKYWDHLGDLLGHNPQNGLVSFAGMGLIDLYDIAKKAEGKLGYVPDIIKDEIITKEETPEIKQLYDKYGIKSLKKEIEEEDSK